MNSFGDFRLVRSPEVAPSALAGEGSHRTGRVGSLQHSGLKAAIGARNQRTNSLTLVANVAINS